MMQARYKPGMSMISPTSLLLVVAAHTTFFYAMWHHRPSPAMPPMVMLSAELIVPPQPKIDSPEATKVDLKAEPVPSPPEKPKVVKKKQPQPKQHRLVASAPIQPVAEPAIPLPEPEPVYEPEPARPKQATQTAEAARPEQMQTGPVTLSSELSLSCPELKAPDYPAKSRQLAEEGKLMLRVELDETGHVSHSHIISSSGYSRLDNAALATVKTWRCRPAIRNGQPVRAIALQPFNFVIQRN